MFSSCNFFTKCRGFRLAAAALLFGAPLAAPASAEDSAATQAGLPPISIEVVEPHVALSASPGSFSTPSSMLEYEPLIDFQSRNLPEAQGDLSIRGGTFENSAVLIGGATIYDPQTGHYLLELPVAPAMLSWPGLLTGLESALHGFNATSGTLLYDWLPIRSDSAVIEAAAGDRRSSSEEAYLSAARLLEGEAGSLGLDLDFAHSESQGSRPHGDHLFSRYSGRLQLLDDQAQTDLFAGYQDKFFSWPYLYALKQLHDLLGSSGIESDKLNTWLLLLNHRRKYDEQSYFQLASTFRRNKDDYEFDRYNPGLFNPYKHRTEFWSAAADGRHNSGRLLVDYSLQVAGDDLESTALTYGDFNSRTFYRAALLPGIWLPVSPQRRLLLQAGTAWDDSNRNSSHLSPLAGITLEELQGLNGKNSWFAQVSQASQLPGYTALASNPSAGLFRGNSGLGRSISTSWETGVRLERTDYEGRAAFFYRDDRNLVDWTYSSGQQPFAARTANSVDIRNFGFESLLQNNFDFMRTALSYAFLQKVSDYAVSDVDASFYALNYPRHRITAGLVFLLTADLELGLDNELRWQEPDLLRSAGSNFYHLAAASLTWKVQGISGLEISALIDNIWNENFEDVPGVPGARRMSSLAARYRW